MLIDWFTVVAQVINFLILVWLLKRFLYRPILNAIDAREQRIDAQLADADNKKLQAEKERDEFHRRNEEFDRQRDAYLSQMKDEAKAERQRLFDMARQESDELRNKLQRAIRNEQQGLHEALSRRAREEVFAIARQVLTDLAATTLEQRMTEIFIHRLQELDDGEHTVLKSAFETAGSPLLVRTAFSLSSQQQTAIETAINDILGGEKQLRFETAPDLVSGIELSADGKKIAWSIADYLATLAKNVDSLLSVKAGTEGTILQQRTTELNENQS